MGKVIPTGHRRKSSYVERMKVDTRHGEFWLDSDTSFVTSRMGRVLLRECYERLLLVDSENHDLLGRILIALKDFDVVGGKHAPATRAPRSERRN